MHIANPIYPTVQHVETEILKDLYNDLHFACCGKEFHILTMPTMKPFSEKRVVLSRIFRKKCAEFPDLLHSNSQILLENMQQIHRTFSTCFVMPGMQKSEHACYTGEVKIQKFKLTTSEIQDNDVIYLSVFSYAEKN